MEESNQSYMENTEDPELGRYEKEPSEKKKKSFGAGVATGVVICIIACMIAGIIIAVNEGGKTGGLLDSADAEKLKYLNGLLDKYYYKEIEEDEKVESIFKGLVDSSGDPYTEYYTKEEYEDLMISTTGNYAGIGAGLSKDKETKEVTIIRIYEGTPAEKAGLMVGDIVLSVDGNRGRDMELDEFVALIRGTAGTAITIEYERDGKTNTVEVKRENITLPSVSHRMLKNNIGYIRIDDFMKGTKKEYDSAMEDLSKQGMEALIFDLRVNGGGLVDSATDILDEILPEGTVVYMKDKNGKRTDYTSDEAHKIDIPIAVLVSSDTASAAEIFTGAIMDFDYGTVIGEKTFGKGIVQSILPLTDGSALKVTTETYYTPKGNAIHGVGLTPDITLELERINEDEEYSLENDNQVEKAIEVLMEKIGKSI